MGPTAEDFQEAFGLSDGEHISTVDANGVALAAIQGLYQVVQEKDAQLVELKQEQEAQLTVLKQENRKLTERLAALEELVLAQRTTSKH